MAFELPALPYDKNALEPHISANTLDYRHGKHHNTYVVNLNNMIADGDMADDDLETISHKVAGDAAKAGVFNNAAQVWNHTFYWHSMKPNGGGKPTGATQFGSGWAWLVLDNGKLKVEKTGNAELPMTKGQTAILTMDVWEHAYYLDFQNRRPDYIATFLNELVNWDFANENLAKA